MRTRQVCLVLVTFILLIIPPTIVLAQAGSSPYDVAASPEKRPTSGYNDGFFVGSENGDYKITIGARVDPMFYWQSSMDYDDVIGTNHGITHRVRAKWQMYF